MQVFYIAQSIFAAALFKAFPSWADKPPLPVADEGGLSALEQPEFERATAASNSVAVNASKGPSALLMLMVEGENYAAVNAEKVSPRRRIRRNIPYNAIIALSSAEDRAQLYIFKTSPMEVTMHQFMLQYM